jgi:hypothetical protein
MIKWMFLMNYKNYWKKSKGNRKGGQFGIILKKKKKPPPPYQLVLI